MDANNPRLRILVHFPQGQISDFQRKQLTTSCMTSTGPSSGDDDDDSPCCVRVATFEGGGDDMDLPIKRILSQNNNDGDSSLITGINSYNTERSLVQTVHLIWCYLQLFSKDDIRRGTVVDFALPTGAMGNLVGGYMAKKMGVPIRRLIAGTNINDILHRVIQTGQFVRSDKMHPTLSEAINIQVPYNFEQILYYLTDGQDDLVKLWMDSLQASGRLDLPSEWLALLQELFQSESVTDEEMCQTLREILRKHEYLCDPHTAVAFGSVKKLTASGKIGGSNADSCPPLILLSTASPCKFEHAVKVAAGAEEWEKYCESNLFPQSGRRMLQLPEIVPEVYKSSGSLEESQRKWEQRAREIMEELMTT